jgi:hypothetical protein
MDFFHGQPCQEIFVDRDVNEAYCRGIPGKEYLIYFPDGGEVKLLLGHQKIEGDLKWLNIETEEWTETRLIEAGKEVTLTCPGPGNWFALIQ